MKRLLRSSSRAWHTIAGNRTTFERSLKRQYISFRIELNKTYMVRQYRTIKSRFQKKYLEDNFAVFWAGPHREKRIGIYALGSCDLPSIFGCMPSIQQVLNGTCCIIREGLVSHSRSDVLLQTLREFPQENIHSVTEKLNISADYFRPRLFEKSFTVPGPTGPQQFPKKLIILSIAADAARTLYRHREHGFLFDPGGWWLNQSMDTVLAGLPTVTWFRENFESVGKIGVDDFAENFNKLISLIRNRTGACVMVFNVLTIDPGSMTHCYQFVKDPPNMRRREFNLALVELSRKLDFPIVDVDRILKRVSVSEVQVDFAHFPMEAYKPIAQEAFAIMRDLRVFETS